LLQALFLFAFRYCLCAKINIQKLLFGYLCQKALSSGIFDFLVFFSRGHYAANKGSKSLQMPYFIELQTFADIL
jgi:hypothetical protein